MKDYTVKDRIWEIDFIRSIAIILMISFHIIYDLKEFYNYSIDYDKGFYFLLGKLAAILFILITAISCSFSRNNFIRGIKILLAALMITIITYFYFPESYINFGILHFLGTSILLYPLIKPLNKFILLFLGVFMIILGLYISNINVKTNIFSPLGFTSSTYSSLDHYPLLPYFGVFLIGVFLKEFYYINRKSLFSFKLPENPFTFLGKHSLLIYIIHQPIILALLYILSTFNLINK